jgi:hypothetical protein
MTDDPDLDPPGIEGRGPVDQDPAMLTGSMVKRFAAYWAGLSRGGALPARRDLDPAAFVFCLPNVLLMDLSHDPLRVRYRLVGTAVTEVAKLDFTGRYLDEVLFPNARFDWMGLYRRLVAERRPLFARVPIESTAELRFYELGLFPLSSDGHAIDKAVAVEDYDMVADRLVQERLLGTRLAGLAAPERDADGNGR